MKTMVQRSYDHILSVTDEVERRRLIRELKGYEEVKNYLLSCSSREDKEYIFENVLTKEEDVKKFVLETQIDSIADCYFSIDYLKEDESVLEILQTLFRNKLKDKHLIMLLVTHLKDDRIFLDAVERYNIEFGFYIMDRVLAIKYDFLRIEYLEKTDNFKLQCALILGLKNERQKIAYINKIRNYEHENGIKQFDETLFTLGKNANSDSFMLGLLEYISTESYRFKLIQLMESDEFKLRALTYVSSSYKTDVMRGLRDDNEKFKFIRNNKLSPRQKYLILASIDDLEYRRSLEDYYFFDGKEIYDDGYDETYNYYDALEDALPPELTFGIELEFEGDRALPILAYGGKLLNKYDVVADTSIPRGVEFVSHVMTYREEDIASIYQVCDFAKKNELYVSSDCALHIHLGSDYLDTYDSLFWLFYIYTNVERILFLISNKAGRLPRPNVDIYAGAYSLEYVSILEKVKECRNTEDFIKLIQLHTGEKEDAINLANIGVRQNTIEMRMSNGEIEASSIVQTVLLFGNLFRLAKSLSKLPLNRNMYELLMAFDKSRTSEQDRLEILLKLLFKEEKNRKVFRRRYKVNSKLYEKSKTKTLDVDFPQISLEEEGICI